jgi:B12-binding domain/radical SAM domain protein
MAPAADLVLLHAPSVYDFRELPLMFGPISDVIPSTSVFEMYPMGFASIADYLERHGLKVRIVNLALLMLNDPGFDVLKKIRSLRPAAFGIDLHWLPHAHGSIEVARLCKEAHPEVPVIFGGFSATYFHRELMDYQVVDFVLMGDSTEEPLLRLLEALKRRDRDALKSIPNLVWRDRNGETKVNELSHVPTVLDHYWGHYGRLMRSALRYRDVRGMLPIHDWLSYPIGAVMTCRGCNYQCAFCGGGREGLKAYANRQATAFRPPGMVVKDILEIASITTAPIFVVGDLRQAGRDYAQEVLQGLKGSGIQNNVVIELFAPADASYLRSIAGALPNFNLEISPESHDTAVRAASGKHYTNDELEEAIEAAVRAGCGKLDVFFMIGLPGQTPSSVMETVEYAQELMARYGKNVVPFISPLAPFIDPGSPIFENPEKFGYRLFYTKLEEFRSALLKASWRHTLSYETRWMSRDQIVEVTYEAALHLNRMKGRMGLIDEATCREVEGRINLARETMERIEEALLLPEERRACALEALRDRLEKVNAGTLCHKDEIRWPVVKRNFRFLNILKAFICR